MPVLSLQHGPDATGDRPIPRIASGALWAYNGSMAHTGENIRAVRVRQGIELERVAAALGRDPAWLAMVEKCQAEPTVPELLRIAGALQTDISELIYGQRFEAKRAIVTRRGERVRVQRARSYEYESLAPRYVGRKVEPLEVTVHPGLDPLRPAAGAAPEPSTHAGEEFLYVLEGRLRIVIDGAVSVLEPGDSVYFDSSLPHELSGAGGPARLVAMTTTANHDPAHPQPQDAGPDPRRPHVRGTRLALVCPGGTSLEASTALEENVMSGPGFSATARSGPRGRAASAGDRQAFDSAARPTNRHARQAAVAPCRRPCRMLMKGDINTRSS